MTECSTSDSLADVSWVQKAALQVYRRNLPLLHTSRYVIARGSVLPGSSPALVLQATNAGAGRPGYEAKTLPHITNSEFYHKWKAFVRNFTPNGELL